MWIKFSELDVDARNALPDNKFAWIDKNGDRHLPLVDANHVRNALARINQTKGLNGTAKQKAMGMIKVAARRYGVDMQAVEFAEPYHGNGPFGPGGNMDWDDKEEPDESEDGGAGDLPKKPKKATAPPPDDQDDDFDDDDEPKAASDKQTDDDDEDDPTAADEPGMSDVHVPGPINQGTKPKKPSTLKGVVSAVRKHLSGGSSLSSEQFDTIVRQEFGRTGGRSKKAEEPHRYVEGSAHFSDSKGDGYRMFLPFTFAEFDGRDGWFQYIPAPGKWNNPRFGKIEITAERNRRFVENFNAGVYQDRIPIDAEHETKLSGALGWISQGRMRLNPDSSISAFAEWTDRGRTLLAEKRFRYFSPEWYDAWTEPASERVVKDVLIGGAVTTRPFFKSSSLQPLVASEQGFQTVKETDEMAGEGEGKNKTEDAAADANAGKQATEAKPKTFAEYQSAIEAAENDAKSFKEQATKLTEELETAKKASEAKADEVRQLSERVTAMETADRRREFAEVAKDFTGETDKHIAIMEKLDEDSLKSYVELQNSNAEVVRASEKSGNIFSAIGSTQRKDSASNDATDTVRQAAEAAVKESDGKLTLEKAMAETWDEAKYAQYAEEHPEQFR